MAPGEGDDPKPPEPPVIDKSSIPGLARDNTAHQTTVVLPQFPSGRLQQAAVAWQAAHPEAQQPSGVQPAVISQGPERTPAYERFQQDVKFQIQLAQYRAQARTLDPVAYDLGTSPGVQAGLAIVNPGIGLGQGAVQTYAGVKTGDATSATLGGVSIFLSVKTMMPARSVSVPMEYVFRTYGGEAQAMGRSWTPINPKNVANYRDAAGLPVGNTGRFVIEGTVRRSNIILRREALEVGENKGGLLEYIINPSKVNIKRVSGVNPEF